MPILKDWTSFKTLRVLHMSTKCSGLSLAKKHLPYDAARSRAFWSLGLVEQAAALIHWLTASSISSLSTISWGLFGIVNVKLCFINGNSTWTVHALFHQWYVCVINYLYAQCTMSKRAMYWSLVSRMLTKLTNECNSHSSFRKSSNLFLYHMSRKLSCDQKSATYDYSNV